MAANFGNLGTCSTYNHFVLKDAVYTAIIGGCTVMPWARVTLVVAEIIQTCPGKPMWTLGIYPPPTHNTVVIDMMSDYWSLQWEEKLCMLIYRTGASEEESVRHCIMVHGPQDFMNLVSYCANARVYQYAPLHTKLPV
ncbi:hypothetical protein FKP32DRAFT_1680924 [Trametes sanguinea]|nr:hypothetical protein FKP32DRAFT_1680924 [Trametes sanguinea]